MLTNAFPAPLCCLQGRHRPLLGAGGRGHTWKKPGQAGWTGVGRRWRADVHGWSVPGCSETRGEDGLLVICYYVGSTDTCTWLTFLEMRAGFTHHHIICVLICILEWKRKAESCIAWVTPMGLCPCQWKGARLGEDRVHRGQVLPWLLGV